MSNTPQAEKNFADYKVENYFERAACVIMLGAGLAALVLIQLDSPALSGNDLPLVGLALAALVLNFRSWRRFAEVIGGRKGSLRAFVLLKSVSVALFIALLVFGKLRGLVIFFLCLVLFLFGGGYLILRAGDGN